MGERSQPLALTLWLKSNMSIYKENCNIYRLWGMGWPRTSYLMRHSFTWGWTACMGLITSLTVKRRNKVQPHYHPCLGFSLYTELFILQMWKKTLSVGWSREADVSDSRCIPGNISVDTWVWPSELPEFPSLAFAEKTAVDRLTS